MDFKIDKDLGNKLDNLLKEGSLDRETEILRILETLSEKLAALTSKEDAFVPPIKNIEARKNRLNKKWGRDPFGDSEL